MSIVADLANGINVGVALQSIVNVVYNILYDLDVTRADYEFFI